MRWDYDFKLEYDPSAKHGTYTREDMAGEQGNIRRFLMYRELGSGFDPDSCSLSKKIYGKLWGWENDSRWFQEIRVGDNSVLMGMDTVNSFATSLFHVFRLSGFPRLTAKDYTPDVEDSIRAAISAAAYRELDRFALLTHTIGNFTLIPKTVSPYTDGGQSFNQARGFQGGHGTYDFFDLGLKLMEMHKEQNQISLDDYARTFFLEDYYSDGVIVPLCNAHAVWLSGNETAANALPGTDELLPLFREINRRIERRGKKIETILSGAISPHFDF